MLDKKTVIVIPARYESSRFPGKPLALICNKPMIQHVYEKAKLVKNAETVLVATDDIRIKECVESFGGNVVMTSKTHPSGSDRIAEAIKNIDADIIVNLQGDEPLTSPKVISELIETIIHKNAQMATVAVPIDSHLEEVSNHNLVKVIKDIYGYAIYFSRLQIPYLRDAGEAYSYLKHWGIYAYTRKTLENFVSWDEGNLEKSEKLEQLRAIEHGVKIFVLETNEYSLGVDSPEDLKKVEAFLQKKL